MKLVMCMFFALAGSVLADGDKKTEKRGVFGLGYGHGLGYAPVAPAPLSHISQVSYSAAHYAPAAVAKVGYPAPSGLPYSHGLGYAAAPAAVFAAPPVAKIGYPVAPAFGYPGHGFDFPAPAYAAYAAPAYAKIALGYGYHH